MSVTGEPSVGWPRRTWVALAPTGDVGRPVAVATKGDPQRLVGKGTFAVFGLWWR